MKNKILLPVLTVFMVFSAYLSPPAWSAEKAKKEESVVVSNGRTVKVHYVLRVDGKVVESSKDKQPLEFKMGSAQTIPGFQKGMIGMKAGQKKFFSVKPEEGRPYDPKLVKNVPLKQLPSGIQPKPDMVLFAKGADGNSYPAKVLEVKGDTVVVDFNHPYAGKILNYEVEVLEVK